jgi:hypothetical protein
MKWFDSSSIEELGPTIVNDSRLFIRCLNNQTKLKVTALSGDKLKDYLEQLQISEDVAVKIVNLFDSNLMSHDEIRDKCISIPLVYDRCI